MGMIIPGHKVCSKCRNMYPRDIGYCPYCKQKKNEGDNMFGSWMNDEDKIEFDLDKKSKTMLTKKEIEQLWEITNKGIDLEDIVKIYDEMYEMMKPIFDLYAKNVKTYLKFKEGK